MKNIYFVAKLGLWMACAFRILVSCEDPPTLTVSPETITFETAPVETFSIDILTSVNWTATLDEQAKEWLSIEPAQGKGDATMTITASENASFAERTALIIIEGVGVMPDTVRVLQGAGLDVAEKIEDEKFRKFCLNEYDLSPQDGKLSVTEVRHVTEMNIKKMEIASLVGIAYFTGLQVLNCDDNDIEQLDVSLNIELEELYCSYNRLTELNVSGNAKLTDLLCIGNALTSLDVTKNTALMMLTCSINRIAELDISNNAVLVILDCDQNTLTNLDVSRNIKLGRLSCGENKLSSLDVRNNPLITQLWCGSNLFTNLDLSRNKSLEWLLCTNSLITTFDLSNNLALKQLNCNGSKQLTSLDLSNNILLVELSCAGAALSGSIDLRKNTKLSRFDLASNRLDVIYVWSGFIEDRINFIMDKNTRWIQ